MKKSYRTCPMCACSTKGTAIHFTGTNAVCDMCRISLRKRGYAWCNRCKREVVLAEYRLLNSACVTCIRRASRTAYQKARETRLAQSRAYYAAHRDARRAYRKAYRQAHLAQDAATKRKRYHDDIEAARERAREYRARRAAANRDRQRRWRRANPDRARLIQKRWRMRQALESWRKG